MKLTLSRHNLVVVSILMVTQTVGWGTSFSLLGVMAQPIGAELSLTVSHIYAGITVMFLIGSVTAPMAGKLADRIGADRLLVAGAAVFALALIALGSARGPQTYIGAWVIFGLGMHFGLATAAYSTIAQLGGPGPRKAIAILTLATGMSSTIFWPLSAYLLLFMDWRMLCFVYAGLVLVVCGGGHIAILALGRTSRAQNRGAQRSGPQDRAEGTVHPVKKARMVFKLLMVAMTLNSAVGTAMALLLIDIFSSVGLARSDAVAIAALLGIAYLASRAIDVVIGNRVEPMVLSMVVFVTLPLSLVPLMVWSASESPVPVWLALASTVAYGLPAGLLGILRPTMPYHLFGPMGYGNHMGRLSRPMDIANALAPSAFAALLPISGAAVLMLAIVLSCLAMAAWVALHALVVRTAQS